MYKRDLEKAEQLHAQWSILDKAAKVAYLQQQWQTINGIIIRVARYFSFAGRYMSPEEAAQFNMLLEMRTSLRTEGQKATDELVNEALHELLKNLLKASGK